MITELGVYTPAELRAGGINSRGFLQPLLPGPAGVDPTQEHPATVEGLARRGLLLQRGTAWSPVGRFERVLQAAAVARSMLAMGPADPADPGFFTPRLVLGCLGTTRQVLDLCWRQDGYAARLLDAAAAAGELIESLGIRSGAVSPHGGEMTGGPGDVVRAVSDHDPAWGRIEGLLRRGVAFIRVEAASLGPMEGPLLQQRLTAVATEEGDWLLLGTRRGDWNGRAAAPAGGVDLASLFGALLTGSRADL